MASDAIRYMKNMILIACKQEISHGEAVNADPEDIGVDRNMLLQSSDPFFLQNHNHPVTPEGPASSGPFFSVHRWVAPYQFD